METSWNYIPVSEINKPRTEIVSGVTLEVVAPYHEVPTAARFSFEESKNQFVIEFRYLTDPEQTSSETEGDVTMVLGKHSKRIYQIRINTSVLESESHKKITFNLVKNADVFLKHKFENFKDVSKSNSNLVERWLDWGIANKRLNLAPAVAAG